MLFRSKLNLSKLAIEKAVSMIAKAVAKSDILIQTDSAEKRKWEYRLNVQPNDHECGTVFWKEVVRHLLTEQEAVIIPLNGKFYRASAWQESDSVLIERLYTNITLNCAGKQYSLYKTFLSSQVIHLRYDNAKIRLLLQNVIAQYDKTLDAINSMIRISSQPKFKLKMDSNGVFAERNADGSIRKTTKEQYVAKIKTLLESDELSVLTEQNGVSLENLQIQSNAKAEELAKVALTINNEVANAFDIPREYLRPYIEVEDL